MNHITRLQLENEMLKNWIKELATYAMSEKFRSDPMMNTGDIRLRLTQLKSDLFNADLPPL